MKRVLPLHGLAQRRDGGRGIPADECDFAGELAALRQVGTVARWEKTS